MDDNEHDHAAETLGQDFWELNWGFKTSGGDCKGHLLHVISRIFPECVDWTGEKLDIASRVCRVWVK